MPKHEMLEHGIFVNLREDQKCFSVGLLINIILKNHVRIVT